jgi:hypothetical protein
MKQQRTSGLPIKELMVLAEMEGGAFSRSNQKLSLPLVLLFRLNISDAEVKE